MIATLESLRSLFRDAFDALWNPFGRREGFSDYEAGDYLLPTAAPAIPRGEVRSALDDLPDSQLLNIAATVIAGYADSLIDVDVLVEALRDRASQFQAVEHDDEPTPVRLDDHLTNSAQTRSE